MPKKVMPSESAVIGKVGVFGMNGKFYVEESTYDKLAEKHKKARDTINYLLDKWFTCIENRMRDQDRVMTATSRYERAVNKISALEKELRLLTKTIHELKMSVMENRELEKKHEQIVLGADPAEFAKKFNMRFNKPIQAFEEPQSEETPEEFNDRTRNYDCE